MPSTSLPDGFTWSKLVPELLVTDLSASLRFWCDLCGFMIAYERPEDHFAYLDRAGCQLMLEEAEAPGRKWITASVERPFGRGVNFQATVDDVTPILNSLYAAGWPLFMMLEEKWYRVGTKETGVRQFLVQDPDGYLVRFSQALGMR